MKSDSDETGHVTEGKRPEHRQEHRNSPIPARGKTPAPHWNSKTMHHPSFRMGEIKHEKS